MFKTCHELTLQNGDKCEVGQYVIAKNPDQLGATVIARVEEVLQVVNSVADLSGMPSHILLQATDVSRDEGKYHMPHIDLTNRWGLFCFPVQYLSPCSPTRS
jgi:hypothetical protein